MGKGKNKGGFRVGPGRQNQTIKQPTQPQVSVEEKMTLDEAKEIIAMKDTILAVANEEAEALKKEVLQEKASIAEARSKLDADIAEFAEKAETLRKDHESQDIIDNAEAIKAEAQAKADKTIADARTVAKTELEKSQKQIEASKAAATQEADSIMAKANDEAKKIIENAQTEAQEESKSIRKNATNDAEGIIAAAREQERIIIDGKEMAAKVRADAIISQAETYASKARESADQYYETIHEKADMYEEETRKKADDRANATLQHAEDLIEQRKKALDSRERAIEDQEKAIPVEAEERAKRILEGRKAELDQIQEQQAKREAELTQEKAQLEYDKIRLKEEHDQFTSRVDQEVNLRHSQTLIDLEEQRSLTNQGLSKIQELTRELNDIKIKFWQLKKEKPDAVLAQATQDEVEALKKDNRSLKSELKKYRDNGITEARIQEFLGLEAENRQLREQRDQLQQDTNDARIAANSQVATADQLKRALEEKKELERKVRALSEELDAKKVSRVDMISPIKLIPASADVQEREIDPPVYKNELRWLEHIKEQADASGIQLPMRQYMAYHTALKIREWSPMVVLAGVSGTGKSELPRQYATHGGMRFVSVPVKPDWDSPASLFGYYNTIENKFEATELLRYLYQMQSKTGVGSTGTSAPWCQDMLVVLLDEMNLAHPEQYFADMLSKFEEARGSTSEPVYDIALGAGEPVEPLRIGKNVLWTGTMNEDETTKGLSDKVTDRSMLITFPRPTELFDRPSGQIALPEFRTSITRWEEWKQNALTGSESILPEEIKRYRKIVEDINSFMSPMGRNLGHRVWQSMQHYIFNYPAVIASIKHEEEFRAAIKMAFCDAVAFKVMPKFRGLEVEGRNKEQFEKIRSCLAANNIDELLPDFDHARRLSSEVFQWCTAEFMR